MKKTLLAVVTSSLFAASANAAVVYDKDGQQVDIYGRVQYQAGRIYNGTTDTTASTYKAATAGKADNFGGDAAARLGVNGKWATGSDVALISKLEWQVAAENTNYGSADANTTNITNRYAFMGADFGNGVQATVGTQDSAYVQLSDVTDVYNEYSGLVENQFASRWSDSAKATYQADGWDLRGSVGFSDNQKSNVAASAGTPSYKNEYSLSSGYTFQFDKTSSLKPVLAYQAVTGNVVAGDSFTNEQYAAGLGYTYDAFYLASTYGQAKYEQKAGVRLTDDQKDTVWTVTGTYKVLPVVTLVAGYGLVDPHNYGTETAKYYVLGAQYDITPKAKAYTEYKINQVANQDDNYYVGLQYNF